MVYSNRLVSIEQNSLLFYKLLQQTKAKVEGIQFTRAETAKRALELNTSMLLNEKVNMLLQAVVEQAQLKVMEQIEHIVTSALNTVYGPGHKFKMVLEQRRNQHEVDFFIDDGNTCIQLKKPFVGKGGGKVTIAALALQLAILESAGLTGPIFLDEITKFVDMDAVNNVAILLKEYALSSGRQVVNITHHEAVAAQADIKISVEKNRQGVAKITTKEYSHAT